MASQPPPPDDVPGDTPVDIPVPSPTDPEPDAPSDPVVAMGMQLDIAASEE